MYAIFQMTYSGAWKFRTFFFPENTIHLQCFIFIFDEVCNMPVLSP